VVELVICELYSAGEHPALVNVAFRLAANKVALAAVNAKGIEVGEVLVHLACLMAQVAAQMAAFHVREQFVVVQERHAAKSTLGMRQHVGLVVDLRVQTLLAQQRGALLQTHAAVLQAVHALDVRFEAGLVCKFSSANWAAQSDEVMNRIPS
jgi:hypothetical protein